MAEKRPQANRDFSKISQGILGTVAQFIVDSMTTNIATFPTPNPSLASLQTLINDYNAALTAAEGGSEASTAAKNVAKQNLIFALRREAEYVNSVAWALSNDPVVQRNTIELSGFTVSKLPDPVGPLAKPFEFTAFPPIVGRRPQPNALTLKYRRENGMSGNGIATLWEYKKSTDTVWVQKFSSAASIRISGLESGVLYNTRCVQIGANSESATYSDQVDVYVL